MNITVKTYNPSINIDRDLGNEIYYIPTANSELVYSQILKNYKQGIRSFSIIGAYGTGKSAFLITLEKALNKKDNPFSHLGSFQEHGTFDVIPIVGEYHSIIELFAQYFFKEYSDNNTTSDIIRAIEKSQIKKGLSYLLMNLENYWNMLLKIILKQNYILFSNWLK
jgi:hypothetical protein